MCALGRDSPIAHCSAAVTSSGPREAPCRQAASLSPVALGGQGAAQGAGPGVTVFVAYSKPGNPMTCGTSSSSTPRATSTSWCASKSCREGGHGGGAGVGVDGGGAGGGGVTDASAGLGEMNGVGGVMDGAWAQGGAGAAGLGAPQPACRPHRATDTLQLPPPQPHHLGARRARPAQDTPSAQHRVLPPGLHP